MLCAGVCNIHPYLSPMPPSKSELEFLEIDDLRDFPDMYDLARELGIEVARALIAYTKGTISVPGIAHITPFVDRRVAEKHRRCGGTLTTKQLAKRLAVSQTLINDRARVIEAQQETPPTDRRQSQGSRQHRHQSR